LLLQKRSRQQNSATCFLVGWLSTGSSTLLSNPLIYRR